MADRIEQLLHRRTDLSTFLVHLTKDTENHTARDNLLSIAESRTIEARSPFGLAKQHDQLLHRTRATQRVVCFSETPLEHTWMMVRDIHGRQESFTKYGLVFTKAICRRRGCNPVWYLDISVGHDWLSNPVNRQVDRAIAESTVEGTVDSRRLALQDILRLTPFMEKMGNPNGQRKEFSWEREWRHVGDFSFKSVENVVALLAPEDDHSALRDDLSYSWKRRSIPLIDPDWGLERMISVLSGVSAV
ncbi:abortive infection system antitoxin AbiGi family protein [Kribbella sp. NPDC056951]|uniref:abortive infection system antitoxin AbiGi family protein n=1 Tax=Kribbella sp. NPDC056951 TaxID=3345978 RepID=UPI0036289E2B